MYLSLSSKAFSSFEFMFLIVFCASVRLQAFYGLEADKKKKRKICTGCHGKVNDQHQQLIEKLVAGESVLSEPL